MMSGFTSPLAIWSQTGKRSLCQYAGIQELFHPVQQRPQNIISGLAGTCVLFRFVVFEHNLESVCRNFADELLHPPVFTDRKAHPEIPDVRFDAYEGSSFLVRHCIEEHGARKIAYIRGPETHNAAQQRYQAYIDQLKKHGIAFDANLVADPVSWWSGDLAMRQFLEERHLVPGKDFDTLICASDLMLYSVAQELAARGYEIGRDVFACGFNDSIESRLMSIPVTTVRMPASELGKSAVRSFYDVVGGRPCKDKELPTTPVIRRSCGCLGDTSWSDCTSTVQLADAIASHFPVSKDTARTVVEKVAYNPLITFVISNTSAPSVHSI